MIHLPHWLQAVIIVTVGPAALWHYIREEEEQSTEADDDTTT